MLLRRRSLNPSKVLRRHSSKLAHSLFEQPRRLSLSRRCLSSSLRIVEGCRPSSWAIFGTPHPHPVRNSIRFLSSMINCFMLFPFVLATAFMARATRPLSLLQYDTGFSPCLKVNARSLPGEGVSILPPSARTASLYGGKRTDFMRLLLDAAPQKICRASQLECAFAITCETKLAGANGRDK